jgi:hypothetical protein
MNQFELQVINLVRQHYYNIGDSINDLTDEQVKRLSLYTTYGLELAVENFKNEYINWYKNIINRFKG